MTGVQTCALPILDMELLLIGGGAKVIQALLGGDLHLTHSGASTVVRAGIAGADLVIAATAVGGTTPYWLSTI